MACIYYPLSGARAAHSPPTSTVTWFDSVNDPNCLYYEMDYCEEETKEKERSDPEYNQIGRTKKKGGRKRW